MKKVSTWPLKYLLVLKLLALIVCVKPKVNGKVLAIYSLRLSPGLVQI